MNERELFIAALQIDDDAQRAAYLDEACSGDAGLRERVEALLKAFTEAGSFLQQPALESSATVVEPAAEKPGALIGPYKLLQVVGEGGMGVVWMAEQSHPMQRRVALKIIKPGMDTRQVIARFEAERQALAVMDHPHIAKVFDAGTTDTGRPYFVMELVKGQPITAYCDEHCLTPRQRLELFVPVCQALQHAHQKGIIHRDIKPSNVLIAPYDGKPVVKVIDFGVAKATGQRLTEKTLFTEFGAVVGTVEYMSPEQAELNNQDIDTRSDIYSLGVLLYELLTGTTPLSRERLKQAAFAEMLRIIREEEPPKPSRRLSDSTDSLPSISAQRQMEPEKLTRLVRGELDWIVMKSLEKDRNRRYETANGLAADVERYLSDEPVQACPPSASYLLRKFVQRHKGLVATASLILIALLIAIAGTTWGLVQAERGRSAAEQARSGEASQRAEAVGNLYDSLVGEARALRLARVVGYREQAWQRLRQAAELGTPKRDLVQLRREAAACLGDFVGLDPTVLKDFGDRRISAIALHPRGHQLALGFTDGSLSLRGLPNGAEIARWSGHPGASIKSVAFDPDGKCCASAAADGTIVLGEPNIEGGWSCKWTSTIDLLDQSLPANSMTIVFTHDGKQLAGCSSGGSTIQFCLTADGQPTDRFEAPDKLSGSMALSPDGRLLAAGHRGNGEHAVRVWDIASGTVKEDLFPKLAQIADLKFSPDGKLLACGCDAGAAVFDTSTFQRQLFFLGGNIFDVDFNPDSQLLAGGTHGATRLWDLVTNRELATLLQPLAPEDPSWSDFVYSIALSQDGKTLVSASRRRIVLWNLAGATERVLLKRFAGGIPGVAFSPQGDLLASVSKDRSVTLWDPATGRLVRDLTGCQGEVQAVAFSPDGRLVAAGDWSKGESVRIWDVNTGRSLVALDPQLGEVWSVTFSRDGQYFAAGGEQGWIVWKFDKDRANGGVGAEPLLQVMTRQQIITGVGCLCFTPDGSLLAWVEFDRTFHLWDLVAACDRQAPVSKLGGWVRTLSRDFDTVERQEQGKWLRLWMSYDQESGEIWDMATGQKVAFDAPLSRELEVLPEKSKNWCRALSPDKTRWAVGNGDGSLALWDLTRVRARLNEAGLGWEQTISPPPAAK
ncbi:MAG: protein kinase [Pirellulales bacterium]